MTKNTVNFTIEKSYANELNNISESTGPSNARMIEKAVEQYLKSKNPKDIKPEKERRQLSFYPSDETFNKLQLVAQDESRSVSSLVSYIVKNFIMELRDDE